MNIKTMKIVDNNQTQIINYGVTDAALAELREKNKDITVTDSKSLKAARVNKSELVGLRTSVEAKRKDLKKDALEYGKRVDTEATRIKAALEEIEAAVVAPIEAYEAKIAVEKAEKERIEQERIKQIKDFIDLRFGTAALVQWSGGDSVTLNDVMEEAKAAEIDDFYQEFKFEAEQQKVRFVQQLESLIADAIAHEEEDKRLKRGALRLERLADEQAERERVFADEQKARQAEIDAENARLKEEQMNLIAVGVKQLEIERAALENIKAAQAATQKAIDDERARLDAEKRAAEDQKEREEFERQAKIQAEEEARDKMAREERENREAEIAARIEAERQLALKPDRDKILAFADSLLELELPAISNDESRYLIEIIHNELMQLSDRISQECDKCYGEVRE